MPPIQLILYFSVAVLTAGIAFKTLKIARMPAHLRWDLYPIPHEKDKRRYGGSYYEETDWWTKPRSRSVVAEIKEIAREIFAIQTLYKNNRNLWYFSFPFHIGLYLLTVFAVLLVAGAIFQERGMLIAAQSQSLLGRIVFVSSSIAGRAGLILGALGAIGLLLSRIIRGELRRYSTATDFFNLLLLLALFLCVILAWLSVDRYLSVLYTFVQYLVTFRPTMNPPAPLAAQLWLTAAFFAYLPFTHMTHFIGKYFTYHKVRWQDDPTYPDSPTTQSVTESLQGIQDWSASQNEAGKSWAEIASETASDPDKGPK